LVGAKPTFIQKPYTQSAALMGLQGWIIASILLFLFLFIANTTEISVIEFLNIPMVLGVILFLFIIGLVVPLFTTKRMISSYLAKIYE